MGRHEAVEELLRVLSDPNIAISVDEIEAIVNGRDESGHLDDYVEASPKCVHDLGLLDQKFDKHRSRNPERRELFPAQDYSTIEADIQLFDPNDPKVRDLEEWNCSIHERSVIEEVSRKLNANRFSYECFFRKVQEEN